MKLKIISIIGFLLLILIVSCQSDEQMEFNRYFSAGSLVYQTHCQNCHGTNGEGLQGLIPSLKDSVYLKSNKNTLACTVKYGLKKNITVLSRGYDSEMPPNDLAPIQIAYVLTYITNSFGNKLGVINSAQVGTDLAECR
jgi:mono/diheme cytochrome c family protein